MEVNREEALKAKEIAEKRFAEKDFVGAKSYAIKAKTLYPHLEGISQMIATFEVYIASERRYNGQIDHYSVLGLSHSADKDAMKKQYRKMAVMLHPDKNNCVGADGAFKLVSEARRYLSEKFDRRRKKNRMSSVTETNNSGYPSFVTGVGSYPNSSISHGRPDTFWTVCTSCKVQYEYLRKYVNKRLSCKNCRGTFIAVETGAAPLSGSFPFSPWSYGPGTTYAGHGYDGATYAPTSGTYFAGNGVSTYHSGHGYEYVTNASYHWSSHSTVSTGILGSCVASSKCTDYVYQTSNGVINRGRAEVSYGVNGTFPSGSGEPSGLKAVRPEKKRRVNMGAGIRNGLEEGGSKSDSEAKVIANSNIGPDCKVPVSNDNLSRRYSAAPAFDIRKLLVDKARKEVKKNLEAISLAFDSAAVAAAALKEKEKALCETGQSTEAGGVSRRGNLNGTSRQQGSNVNGPQSINVPDPDFHDFDQDRSEGCFKQKQIWAIYDEDDGMPRLYCLIREIISTNPFKILITYLNSKTDTEFGYVNWIDSGFTKSCGHFRAWNSDLIEHVNIFSHLLKGEKAGRGGCVRIFPKLGEIWALYLNWSPDWDHSTPDDVRHQYEMVEVLNDYSEELGARVAPLVKLAGFKTVYQRNTNEDAIRWIPRREMVRFSHQVPSWLIKDETSNLPENCWDLDPAATPEQLLNAETKAPA